MLRRSFLCFYLGDSCGVCIKIPVIIFYKQDTLLGFKIRINSIEIINRELSLMNRKLRTQNIKHKTFITNLFFSGYR